MKESDFDIFRTNRHWIIKRSDGEYKQHSHFDDKQSCELLKKLILKGIMPEQSYFRTAAKRILTDDEFNGLRVKQKYHYYNRNAKQFGRRAI